MKPNVKDTHMRVCIQQHTLMYSTQELYIATMVTCVSLRILGAVHTAGEGGRVHLEVPWCYPRARNTIGGRLTMKLLNFHLCTCLNDRNLATIVYTSFLIFCI